MTPDAIFSVIPLPVKEYVQTDSVQCPCGVSGMRKDAAAGPPGLLSRGRTLAEVESVRSIRLRFRPGRRAWSCAMDRGVR